MSSAENIWNQLVEHRGHAPRELVVAYTKAVIAEAKRLRLAQLAARGSVDTMSVGEIIASNLITALAQQDWLDDNDKLSEVLAIAGQIDMEADSQQLWRELFEMVDRL